MFRIREDSIKRRLAEALVCDNLLSVDIECIQK